MSHFQIPNISLTPKRLLEISSIVEDITVSYDIRRTLLRELYNTILPGNEVYRQKLTQWYRMPDIPFHEISVWIDTQLIPTMNTKYSELAKKRRQTPRRRYTLKRKESKSV